MGILAAASGASGGGACAVALFDKTCGGKEFAYFSRQETLTTLLGGQALESQPVRWLGHYCTFRASNEDICASDVGAKNASPGLGMLRHEILYKLGGNI